MIIIKINKAVLLRNSQLRVNMYIKRNALGYNSRYVDGDLHIMFRQYKRDYLAWKSYIKLPGGGDISSGS